MPASIDAQYARAIGQQIAQARRAQGLTQGDLSRRVGNSKNAVSSWERGASAPTVQNLRELCEVLSVTPQQLLLMNGASADEETPVAATDLLRSLKRIRRQAEKAFPDLLSALKDAEARAQRVAEPKKSR